tara:strand:+ start:1054 stop:1332 length:279 start_codon:yes stop_codon:yes gene_type:complete
MGRAIDMEKDIDKLNRQVERIDAALAKVIDVVDSMQDKVQRTIHVDLVEDDWDPNEIAVEAQKMMEEGAEKHVEEKAKKKKSNEKAKRPKKD